MNMQTAVMSLLRRDLLLSYRQRQELLNPLFFFAVVVTLFPLGITADHLLLSKMACGVVWVAALLANLMTLDKLFRDDSEDGSLDQLLLSPTPLWMLVLSKILAQWLVTGLPLTIIAPVLAYALFLPAEGMTVLVATLLIGTPLITLIGAIGAALTLSVRNSGVLLSLLVLPLYIPVLILSTGAVQAALQGLPVIGYFAWLIALLFAGITLAPFAIASALRISH
jgi:heme exporter protein B